MFESLIKSKLKEIIRNQMINKSFNMKSSELIKLINKYTDNEFSIKIDIKDLKDYLESNNDNIEILFKDLK